MIQLRTLSIVLVTLLTFSSNSLLAQGQDQSNARVLVPSDKLYFSRLGSKQITQSKDRGELIPEGAAVVNFSTQSAEIELPGGQVIILGAHSTLELSRIKESAPIILTLSKGLLRYRQAAKRVGHYPTLLFSPVGIVGVRGDDVLVMASKNSKLTSVLSFIGEARFVAVTSEAFKSEAILDELSFSDIERDEDNRPLIEPKKHVFSSIDEKASYILASDQAVSVMDGQYSSIIPAWGVVSKPAAINPLQFKHLLLNRQLSFTTTKSELKIVDPNIYNEKEIGVWPKIPSSGPEGRFDPKAKIFAPKSGGLVDLTSGLYSSPGTDAAFDNTGSIYLPGKLFHLDGQSGQLVAPTGLIPSDEHGYTAKLSASRSLENAVKESFNLGVLYGLKGPSGEKLSVIKSAPSRSELSNRQRLEFSLGLRTDSLEATRPSTTQGFDSSSKSDFRLKWISESYKKWGALAEIGYSSAEYDSHGAQMRSKGLFSLMFGATRLLTSRFSLLAGVKLDQRHFLDIQTINNAASAQIVRATMGNFFTGVDATLFEAFSGRLKWSAAGMLNYSLSKDEELLSIDAGVGYTLRTGPWWWYKQKFSLGLTYEYQGQSYETTGVRESIDQSFSRSVILFSASRVF